MPFLYLHQFINLITSSWKKKISFCKWSYFLCSGFTICHSGKWLHWLFMAAMFSVHVMKNLLLLLCSLSFNRKQHFSDGDNSKFMCSWKKNWPWKPIIFQEKCRWPSILISLHKWFLSLFSVTVCALFSAQICPFSMWISSQICSAYWLSSFVFFLSALGLFVVCLLWS